MLLSGGSLAEAQVRTIAGRVVDAYTGRAIAAGRVWIKGTHIEDKLRPDGVFVLRAPAPASGVVLVVHSDGYRRREVAVSAGQGTVSIDLRADVPELAPVVVVAGATATRRRNSAHSSVGLGRAPDR